MSEKATKYKIRIYFLAHNKTIIYQAVISDSIQKVRFLERKFKFALTEEEKVCRKNGAKKLL